jgi:hypothetical protein
VTGGDFTIVTCFCAGIGAGSGFHGGSANVATLTVSGGRGTINGTFAGAGIGGGRATDAGTSTVGSVRVSGGTFTIAAEDAAGIGAGPAYGGVASVGSLVIDGGAFEIETVWGAAVGAGIGEFSVDSGTDGVSIVGEVTISGGTFGGATKWGAGVGAGCGYEGRSEVTKLVISGGSFTLASEEGAGVGAGRGENGTSTVGEVLIGNADFNITAPIGGGVGAGFADEGGNSSVERVTIAGAVIEVAGLTGIGPGAAEFGVSRVGELTVNGRLEINATTTNGCFAAAAIAFGSAEINGSVLGGKLFRSGATVTGVPTSLWVVYARGAPIGTEGVQGLSLLHFGEVDVAGDTVALTLAGGVRGSFDFEVQTYRGLIVASKPGTVVMQFQATDYGVTLTHGLCSDGVFEFLVEEGKEAFYQKVWRCTATRVFTLGMQSCSGPRRIFLLTAFQFFLVV